MNFQRDRRRARSLRLKGPDQLQRLFQLRFVEGVTDRELLAQALGVQPRTLTSYYRRLRAKIDAPKGSATSEEQVEKHKDFVCPECLKMTVKIVGIMRVCHKCGLELGRWELDPSLPFDTTYAPTSSMALGRSLGGTLPSKQAYRVLMMSPTGRKDIGLRARYINIIHEANESPTVKKLLEYGSGLLKNLGLEERHVFANIYADHLRKLGAYLEAKRLSRTHRYAHALLGHLVIDLAPDSGAVKARLKYDDHESTFIKLWLRLDELANGEKEELEFEEARSREGDIQGFTLQETEKEPGEDYWLRLGQSEEKQSGEESG